jgi:hypothetical protein
MKLLKNIKPKHIMVLVVVVPVALLGLSVIQHYVWIPYQQSLIVHEDVKITVTKTERVTYGVFAQEHKYLIYGYDPDTGEPVVVENVDDPKYGKYDSSNVYALILPGHTYSLTTVGERAPPGSLYPNIIEYEEVK